jgi:hypothetical protein
MHERTGDDKVRSTDVREKGTLMNEKETGGPHYRNKQTNDVATGKPETIQIMTSAIPRPDLA